MLTILPYIDYLGLRSITNFPRVVPECNYSFFSMYVFTTKLEISQQAAVFTVQCRYPQTKKLF